MANPEQTRSDEKSSQLPLNELIATSLTDEVVDSTLSEWYKTKAINNPEAWANHLGHRKLARYLLLRDYLYAHDTAADTVSALNDYLDVFMDYRQQHYLKAPKHAPQPAAVISESVEAILAQNPERVHDVATTMADHMTDAANRTVAIRALMANAGFSADTLKPQTKRFKLFSQLAASVDESSPFEIDPRVAVIGKLSPDDKPFQGKELESLVQKNLQVSSHTLDDYDRVRTGNLVVLGDEELDLVRNYFAATPLDRNDRQTKRMRDELFNGATLSLLRTLMAAQAHDDNAGKMLTYLSSHASGTSRGSYDRDAPLNVKRPPLYAWVSLANQLRISLSKADGVEREPIKTFRNDRQQIEAMYTVSDTLKVSLGRSDLTEDTEKIIRALDSTDLLLGRLDESLRVQLEQTSTITVSDDRSSVPKIRGRRGPSWYHPRRPGHGIVS